MDINSIKHRGLKRLIENDDHRGLRSDLVKRTRNILTALMAAETVDAVRGPPGWRLYQLTGDRAETWSLSVSGNWRIIVIATQKLAGCLLERPVLVELSGRGLPTLELR